MPEKSKPREKSKPSAGEESFSEVLNSKDRGYVLKVAREVVAKKGRPSDGKKSAGTNK